MPGIHSRQAIPTTRWMCQRAGFSEVSYNWSEIYWTLVPKWTHPYIGNANISKDAVDRACAAWNENRLAVFTDGSYQHKDKFVSGETGGFAWLLVDKPSQEILIHGGGMYGSFSVPSPSSSRMELCAITGAVAMLGILRQVSHGKSACAACIYTDFKAAVDMVCAGRVTKPKKKSSLDLDLVNAINHLLLLLDIPTTMTWVEAHTRSQSFETEMNRKADRCAKENRKHAHCTCVIPQPQTDLHPDK
jgi:ribonuclease HI